MAKPTDLMVVCPPGSTAYTGCVIGVRGRYAFDNGKASLDRFDLVHFKDGLEGTGAQMMADAKALAWPNINNDYDPHPAPTKTILIKNGWPSYQFDNAVDLDGVFEVTEGSDAPDVMFNGRVGYRWLVDYMRPRIRNRELAGMSFLTESELRSLMDSLRQATYRPLKQEGETGESELFMREQDFVTAALGVALHQLERWAPWGSGSGGSIRRNSARYIV